MLICTCLRSTHINLHAFIKTGIHIVFIFACKSIHIMFMYSPGMNVSHENFIRCLSLAINNLKQTCVYKVIPPLFLALHKSTWGRDRRRLSEPLDILSVRAKRLLLLKNQIKERKKKRLTQERRNRPHAFSPERAPVSGGMHWERRTSPSHQP